MVYFSSALLDAIHTLSYVCFAPLSIPSKLDGAQMLGEPIEISSVIELDAFYEHLAETAEKEGLCLPWYKTCLVVDAPQQRKRFRSEITLPALRLQTADGRRYFVPEAKFTGTGEIKKEAENAAAREACGYLMTFIQRTELIAAEWSIDESNPVYTSIAEAHAQSTSSESATGQPSEGHHLLVIAPIGRPHLRTRDEQRRRPTESVQQTPASPSPSTPRSDSSPGHASSSDGAHLTHLSNEVNLLRMQIDRLHAIVERHQPQPQQASASITQPASSSYRSEIEPA